MSATNQPREEKSSAEAGADGAPGEPAADDANSDFDETKAGLQISGLKFQSLDSNSRELELSNFTGLVLGCIEAKFCK